ncbi:MAG: hypothetical protein AAF657_41925, partial [Acidobacteriota bacterium]
SGLLLCTLTAGSAAAQSYWLDGGTDKIVTLNKVTIGPNGQSAQLSANASSSNFTFKNQSSGAMLLHYNNTLRFRQGTGNGPTTLLLDTNGDVTVGSGPARSKLSVEGTITAEEVVVTQEGWPDFVFDEDYPLTPLPELESAIRSQGHLPGIPSAAEVEAHGVGVGEMQALLLQKVEELTLYLIALEKKNRQLEAQVAELSATPPH